MKEFHLYIRMRACDQWTYAETFTDPNLYWAGMMLARHRGFQTKLQRPGCVGMDNTVLAVQS